MSYTPDVVLKAWNEGTARVSSKNSIILGKDIDEKVQYVLGLGYLKLPGMTISIAESVLGISLKPFTQKERYIRLGTLLYNQASPDVIIRMQLDVRRLTSRQFKLETNRQSTKEFNEQIKTLGTRRNINNASASISGVNIYSEIKRIENVNESANRHRKSLYNDIAATKRKNAVLIASSRISNKKKKYTSYKDSDLNDLAKRLRYLLSSTSGQKVVQYGATIEELMRLANALNISITEGVKKKDIIEDIIFNIVQYVASIKTSASLRDNSLAYTQPTPDGLEMIKELLKYTNFWMLSLPDGANEETIKEIMNQNAMFKKKYEQFEKAKGSEASKLGYEDREQKTLNKLKSKRNLKSSKSHKGKRADISTFLMAVLHLSKEETDSVFESVKSSSLDEEAVLALIKDGTISLKLLYSYAEKAGILAQYFELSSDPVALIIYLSKHFKSLNEVVNNDKIGSIRFKENLVEELTFGLYDYEDKSRKIGRTLVGSLTRLSSDETSSSSISSGSSVKDINIGLPMTLSPDGWKKASLNFQPVYVMGGHIYTHKINPSSDMSSIYNEYVNVEEGEASKKSNEMFNKINTIMADNTGMSYSDKIKKVASEFALNDDAKKDFDDYKQKKKQERANRRLIDMVDERVVRQGINKLASKEIQPVFLVNKGINVNDVNSQMILDLLPKLVSFIPVVGPYMSAGVEVLMDELVNEALSNMRFATGGKIKASKDDSGSTSFISGDSLNKNPNPEMVTIDWNSRTADVKPMQEGNKTINNNVSNTSFMSSYQRQQAMPVGFANSLITYENPLQGGKTEDNTALKVYPVNNPFGEYVNVNGTSITPMEALLAMQNTLASMLVAIQEGNNISTVIANANSVMVKEIGKISSSQKQTPSYHGNSFSSILGGR